MNETRNQTPTVRLPLKVKLSAMAIIVSVLPLLAVGVLVIDANEKALRTSLLSLQRSIVSELEGSLERDVHGAENALAAVGHALSDDELAPDTRIEVALKFLSGNAELTSVAVFSTSGERIDTLQEIGLTHAAHPPSLKPSEIDTAGGRGIFRSAPMKINTVPHIYVVQPLSSGKNVTGFVGGYVSLQPILNQVRVLSDDFFLADPDSLFVTDLDRRYIAHSTYDKKEEFVSAADHPALVGFSAGALAKPVATNARTIDAAGRRYVSTVIANPELGWVTVAQTPESVAFESLSELKRWIFVLTALAALFAIVVAIVFSARLTKPLESLVDAARRLARREFDDEPQVQTQDEVGVLAHAMHQASHDLRESEKVIAKEAAIRQDLGRYIPHEVVERIVTRKQDMNLGGEKREITVLFADVVEFTPLTEQLAPHDVVTLLNELFTILTEIIFRHQGMVDKFVGDSVMGIFGAPDALEGHADHAVAAAQEMMRWLEIGNARWSSERGVQIRLAIGIHSGDAVVGNVGSNQRMEYTAIGETVNVAARLEAVARPKQILFSRQTRDLLKKPPSMLHAGSHSLAGMGKPVEVFSIDA